MPNMVQEYQNSDVKLLTYTPKKRTRLSFMEMSDIAGMKEKGYSAKKIAELTGRSKSSIYRALKRESNEFGFDSYRQAEPVEELELLPVAAETITESEYLGRAENVVKMDSYRPETAKRKSILSRIGGYIGRATAAAAFMTATALALVSGVPEKNLESKISETSKPMQFNRLAELDEPVDLSQYVVEDIPEIKVAQPAYAPIFDKKIPAPSVNYKNDGEVFDGKFNRVEINEPAVANISNDITFDNIVLGSDISAAYRAAGGRKSGPAAAPAPVKEAPKKVEVSNVMRFNDIRAKIGGRAGSIEGEAYDRMIKEALTREEREYIAGVGSKVLSEVLAETEDNDRVRDKYIRMELKNKIGKPEEIK